ncbi:recombination mediator RecR [Patescibacteria group bacterium]|nr:recombination mediator RecR [Patescibacteria group bacterium]
MKIQRLIALFTKFPTVGPRTASRFVYYLIKHKPRIDELIEAIKEIKEMKYCRFCFNPIEEGDLCSICRNHDRDKSLICVVGKETDLATIENTKTYKGLYFILGGNVSILRKNIEEIRLKELEERLADPHRFGVKSSFKEVILATNPTPEGKATADLVIKAIKEKPLKITHLGLGLPIGAELEYADEETLENAFKSRR